MKPVRLPLLLLLTASHLAAADPAAPPTQRVAFHLGFALQAPAAQTEQFLQSVKELKTVTDDAQGASEVGKLAKQSAALRETEARAYGQASQMLRAMGGPIGLQTWTADTAKTLSQPLVLSKEAQGYLQSDPNAATVLGAIDEAQAIKTNADSHMTGLITWIKLSRGTNAVWATALGGLDAGMDAAVWSGRSLFVSRTDLIQMHDSAPVGTPPAVLDALDRLSPRRGNLAPLIRLPSAPIPPKDLAQSHKVLLDSYGAQEIADAIDKG